jgi:hypothetical protein
VSQTESGYHAYGKRDHAVIRGFILRGKIELRNGNDRRKANPFGANGPWLTTGKMGGLVFTDRRKSAGRRSTDRQFSPAISAD